jgi:hypothetical protein
MRIRIRNPGFATNVVNVLEIHLFRIVVLEVLGGDAAVGVVLVRPHLDHGLSYPVGGIADNAVKPSKKDINRLSSRV